MTPPATPPHSGGWAPCRCCGLSYPAARMVPFHSNPGDRLCLTCTEWLYSQSRPIARQSHPVWQLASRILPRRTPAA